MLYPHPDGSPAGVRRRVALPAAAIVITVLVAAATSVAATSHHGRYRAYAGMARSSPATAPASEDVLGGVTADGWPVVFRISKDAKVLLMSAIGVNMTCTSGVKYSTSDGWTRAPFAAHGRLRLNGTVPLHTFQDGSSLSETDVVRGLLTPKPARLTGTWEVHDTWIGADGKHDECDSGPVKFTARS